MQSYLDSRAIQWWPAGSKNVGRGWIGITCIFHADHSNHLGIHLASKKFKCLVCGRKGFIVELVQRLEGGISEAQANAIIRQFQTSVPYVEEEPKKRARPGSNILPPEARVKFLPAHLNYLRMRNFDPDAIINKYGLLCCGPVGLYKFRIVIPVFMKGRVVNFTARDITGQSDTKYRTCPNAKAVLPVEECLYNIDNVRGSNVLDMEGPTDVWRVGDNSVANLGMNFNYHRALLLHDRGVRNVFIMFDAEPKAQQRARETALTLKGIMEKIEILELPSGDPANLSQEEVDYLRRELKL